MQGDRISHGNETVDFSGRVNPAVYGIIGVIVGALATGGMQLAIERRRDRTRSRAAARLVAEEFVTGTVALMKLRRRPLGESVDAGEFVWPQGLWLENRGQLASALTPQEWMRVRNAAQAVAITKVRYQERADQGVRVVLDQKAMNGIAGLEHTMREGTAALNRIAGHPIPRWKRLLFHVPGGSKFLGWYHSREVRRMKEEVRGFGYQDEDPPAE